MASSWCEDGWRQCPALGAFCACTPCVLLGNSLCAARPALSATGCAVQPTHVQNTCAQHTLHCISRNSSPVQSCSAAQCSALGGVPRGAREAQVAEVFELRQRAGHRLAHLLARGRRAGPRAQVAAKPAAPPLKPSSGLSAGPCPRQFQCAAADSVCCRDSHCKAHFRSELHPVTTRRLALRRGPRALHT